MLACAGVSTGLAHPIPCLPHMGCSQHCGHHSENAAGRACNQPTAQAPDNCSRRAPCTSSFRPPHAIKELMLTCTDLSNWCRAWQRTSAAAQYCWGCMLCWPSQWGPAWERSTLPHTCSCWTGKSQETTHARDSAVLIITKTSHHQLPSPFGVLSS